MRICWGEKPVTRAQLRRRTVARSEYQKMDVSSCGSPEAEGMLGWLLLVLLLLAVDLRASPPARGSATNDYHFHCPFASFLSFTRGNKKKKIVHSVSPEKSVDPL